MVRIELGEAFINLNHLPGPRLKGLRRVVRIRDAFEGDEFRFPSCPRPVSCREDDFLFLAFLACMLTEPMSLPSALVFPASFSAVPTLILMLLLRLLFFSSLLLFVGDGLRPLCLRLSSLLSPSALSPFRLLTEPPSWDVPLLL